MKVQLKQDRDMTWVVSINLVSVEFGDGYFTSEIETALEGYLKLVRDGTAAIAPCEAFVTPKGTTMTVIAEGYFARPVRL